MDVLNKTLFFYNRAKTKMKKYTNVLLGIVAIIGLIGLSNTPAFADSIHNALDNNLVANETLVPGRIANRFELTSRTTHDYAKEYFHAGDRVKRKRNGGEQWSLFIQGNRVNL